MRDRLDRGYRALLKLSGLYGHGVLWLYFSGLRDMVAAGQTGLAPSLMALVTMLLAAALLCPGLLPPSFAFPHRRRHLGPVLIGNCLFPFLFILPSKGATLALDLPEPLARPAAVMAVGVPFALFAASWGLGIALCLMREGRSHQPLATTPTQPIVPRRPRHPKLSAEQLCDLRRQRGG